MANGDRTILYVDKVELDKYTADGQRIFNVAVYKNTNTSGAISFNSILTTETYDNGDGTVGTHVSMFNTANISLDTIETINNKQYYKINAYIYIDQYEGYTYTKGQQLFFGICADTMANEIFTSENNFEQTVVEFDYDLNKATPDYFLWDATDGVESLKISYTEPPHKIISEIQYPDETIYDIKDKNALNKSQITNCLLEVPQRIKYELADGTLTIKAGSVVIVPYGTEDLTAQYPVGATFLNDNFKVSDIQFEDGKFFVWAKLVNDLSGGFVVSEADAVRKIAIRIDSASIVSSLGQVSGASPVALRSYTFAYNTTTNLIGRSENNTELTYTNVYSLPFMSVISATINSTLQAYGSIDQVFNGIGYIGSTVWVDKGVKGLIPNGRNADGTLKNIEYTTPNLIIRTWSYESINQPLFISTNGLDIPSGGTYYVSDTEPISPTISWVMWHNPRENIMRYSNDNDKWTVFNSWLFTGVYTSTSNSADNYRLTQFTLPKLPFRALDYGDIWYDSSTQTLHIGG